MNLKNFKCYTKQDILSITKVRRFETKLGERVHTLAEQEAITESLAKLPCKYIVLGIPEDIGVQANMGMPGTSTCWLSFLQYFLNLQSNDFLSGDNIAVIGYFDFGNLQYLIDNNAQNSNEKVEAYRHAVNTVDDDVERLIKAIVALEKVPVVIGGGSNNAYPLLKGAAKGLHQLQKVSLPQINCISVSAHTNYQPIEGRHNGNAFRYAEEDGFLQKVCMVGIQESELQQNVWMEIVNNIFLECITYENIFLYEERTFQQAIIHAIEFTEDSFTGIELNMNSVQNMASSTSTPCGIDPKDARQYIMFTASESKAAYLHISEGAAQLADGRTNNNIGQFISYLVNDFIKVHADVTDSKQ